ncbi:hypothetical protein [Trueperella pecoris]|uniref:hypothetical protein n=1 Tax=Trueperella pecoris TaxID=2733571 RepID=UPI00186B8149|nr:hypothetical protein [Trueperella pecoris]QOQ39434.1 hypothetical protein HLG82_08280 [Trueperella pecoris]
MQGKYFVRLLDGKSGERVADFEFAKQTAPVPPETDKPGTDPKEPGKKPEAPETTPKPEPKPVPTPGKTSGTVDNTVTQKYDQVKGVKVVGTNDPIFPEASDPASCTVKPFATIVPMKGVSYSVTVDGEEIASVEGNGSKFEYPYGKTVVVTAKAVEGYQLAKGAKTEWSWTAPTLEELKCTIPAHKLVPGQTIPGNSVPGVIVPDVEGQQINDTLKIIIDRALKGLSAGASEKGATVVAEKAAPAKAEKATAKAQKPLAHTGATVAGLSIAAVVLLLAGGAVALIRRRQG